MPDFTLKPTFPVASVIDAAQRNNQLQLAAQQAGQQSLIQGLQSIGQVGQSLYDQKMKMAQALAASKLYAQTPEGQQMMGTNPVTSSPSGQPVTQNQTAAFNPATGSVTPNQSPVNAGTLQTAFMGESPSNLLTQLYERQKQRQEFGLQQQKQAFTEKIEPQKLAQQAALTEALTGIRNQQIANENQANIRNQITALESKKAQAIKDFPELYGTFIRGILPAGSNAKEEAAFKDYQDTQRQIETYQRQLNGWAPNDNPAKNMSTADLLAVINQNK